MYLVPYRKPSTLIYSESFFFVVCVFVSVFCHRLASGACGMADYEDPVRWEVAAQTRTLLSSNASLLESVASSKLIGGGRRPVKLGEFSSTLRPTEEVVGGSSPIWLSPSRFGGIR